MGKRPNSSQNKKSTNTYERAVARIENELGLSQSQARQAIAGYAAAHGMFLDDVAQAVVRVKTIKRGLNLALKQMPVQRRPPTHN